MKKSVVIFVNDYKDLTKLQLAFWKKHWKGMVVMTVVIVGAEIAVFELENNQDKIKAKIRNVTKRKPKKVKIEA